MNTCSPLIATTSRASRKKNGSFYTPPEIAAYVTRQTLKPLLQGRPPSSVKQLRILDPACGGGVFVQEAFKLLLQSYQERGSPRDSRGIDLAIRKRILRSQLFGVDQDEEAIEVTKANLARICVTPHDEKPLTSRQNRLIHDLQRDLSPNFCRGNALIAPDELRPVAESGNDIQPFDWRATFADVFSHGGFDAVIGNPPFINIRQLTLGHGEAVKASLNHRYQCARGAYDTYVLFVEKALELLRPAGMCGFIVPNKIATLGYAQPCREMLLQQTTIHRIDDVYAVKMFQGAGVYP